MGKDQTKLNQKSSGKPKKAKLKRKIVQKKKKKKTVKKNKVARKKKLTKKVKFANLKKQAAKKENVLKKHFLPGQKNITPEENDGTRIFYESWHQEEPSNKLPQKWMLEQGLLPIDLARKLAKKKH